MRVDGKCRKHVWQGRETMLLLIVCAIGLAYIVFLVTSTTFCDDTELYIFDNLYVPLKSTILQLLDRLVSKI